MSARNLLWLFSALLVAAMAFFLLYNVQGHWDFALPFRAKKLALLLLVAYAIGISTLLFQTLTQNPILTPSILGFDSLYLLTQTVLVFLFGGVGFSQLPLGGKFVLETALMLGGALLLFRALAKNHADLTRMILIGVIFGVLFRSLSSLLQRLIDPNDFAVAQGAYFASFNNSNGTLLTLGGAVALVSLIWIWQQRFKLDVLLLGRNPAINLGLEYARFSRQLLICSALLVSVSTALVGPILFLGLLVCALANALCPTAKHSVRLPLTGLISALTLVLGQAIFEQILKMQGVLSVVIELIGGLVFIGLMLKKNKT